MNGGILRPALQASAKIFEPPVSKSDAIRLLFIQHARGDQLENFGPEAPEDVRIAADALAKLGECSSEIELSMGLGAAPFRFVLALAAMRPGGIVRIDAEPELRRRPHVHLEESLCAALCLYGLRLNLSTWPATVDTRKLVLPRRLQFAVKPESSQFVSALLMAGAKLVAGGLCDEVSVLLDGEPASAGYLELTVGWLADAGFDMRKGAGCLRIAGYSPVEFERAVPPDWSSAAYLAVWAWRCGGGVRVDAGRTHPDAEILGILERAGIESEIDSQSILRLSGDLKCGLYADAGRCPDLIPTLAAVALAAPGTSVFDRVGVLRAKESDRLEFIIRMAASAGGTARLEAERVVIEPPERLAERVEIETRSDHRRALAGSLLAALGMSEVVLDDTSCVVKSFPAYWREINSCASLESF